MHEAVIDEGDLEFTQEVYVDGRANRIKITHHVSEKHNITDDRLDPAIEDITITIYEFSPHEKATLKQIFMYDPQNDPPEFARKGSEDVTHYICQIVPLNVPEGYDILKQIRSKFDLRVHKGTTKEGLQEFSISDIVEVEVDADEVSEEGNFVEGPDGRLLQQV